MSGVKCISKKLTALFIIFCMACSITSCGIPSLDSTFNYYQNYNHSALAIEKDNKDFPSYMAESLCVVTKKNILLPSISTSNVKAAAVFNCTTGETLYAYNVLKKRYPASTTKIMTAYLTLKYGNLKDKVTISKNATILPSGASSAGYREGDVVTVSSLLYSLILISANDAAIALAEHISGSVKEFADLMNKEALKIGATNTNFVNPNGLHDENHYTTVYDLYLIFQEACKLPKFQSYIHTRSKTVKWKHADGSEVVKNMETTNRFLTKEQKHPKGYNIVGGKTGTTYNAGSCLVLLTTNEKKEDIIIITLGANNRDHLYSFMFDLMKSVKKSE